MLPVEPHIAFDCDQRHPEGTRYLRLIRIAIDEQLGIKSQKVARALWKLFFVSRRRIDSASAMPSRNAVANLMSSSYCRSTLPFLVLGILPQKIGASRTFAFAPGWLPQRPCSSMKAVVAYSTL